MDKGHTPGAETAPQDTADLRISDDPGRYLCDFIYFSSLAHLHRRRERRRAVFLHVPSSCSDEALQRGTDLTLQLIRAICESEQSRPREEPPLPPPDELR